MDDRHGNHAGGDDRRSSDAERGLPRTCPQEGRTVARETVAHQRTTSWRRTVRCWRRTVRCRIRLDEPSGTRRGDHCGNRSGRSGFPERGGRDLCWQRVTVRAAACICAPQPGCRRGSFALLGRALVIPGLGGALAPDGLSGTGARGTGDRLMRALHGCRFIGSPARAATHAGDPPNRPWPSDRRA